jgi:hypothetical protein
MQNAHDPLRLSVALRSAIVEGSWNPTDWGRTLLGHLDSALRIPTGDGDQDVYRTTVAQVAVSDLMVHVRGEIADGLIPASLVAVALVPTTGVGPVARPAPEMPHLPMAA